MCWKKLARDFYVVTLPTIVKIQDSPSPSPYQDISESESDTESRGVGSGEWGVAPVTRCWHLRHGGLCCAGQCAEIQWPWGLRVRICRVPGVSLSVVTKLWSPDDCLRHYGHYDPWHQPVIITPSQAYNHRTSDTSPPPMCVCSHSLLKKYSEFYKTWYSLTTSRWDRSICKKSLILMHFLCFTQPRGAWFRPILYL